MDFAQIGIALRNGRHVATKNMAKHGRSLYLVIDKKRELLFERFINPDTQEEQNSPVVLYWDELHNTTWQILN